MARSVTEWIGRTDDTPPSAACKRRILDRQDYRCALTGLPFDDKHKPRFDHKVPLWLGGANRESNLQALREDEAHKPKTRAEAKVRAKVHAVIDKRFDLGRPKQKIPSRPKPSPKPSPKQPRIDKSAFKPLEPRQIFRSATNG